MKNDEELKVEDVERIFANPYYCLENWTNGEDIHTAMVSEEEWIKAGANLIKEIGPEKYLRHLLENLKGNYI
jgi:hypothetical protein